MNVSASFNGSNLSAPLEKALTYGANGENSVTNSHINNNLNDSDEIHRLKDLITEKEKKWRVEYERVTNENETLRSKAGESILATQWRTRYEGCLREKEELTEKLLLYTKLSNEFNNGPNSGGGGVDQAFADMQMSLQVSLLSVQQAYAIHIQLAGIECIEVHGTQQLSESSK